MIIKQSNKHNFPQKIFQALSDEMQHFAKVIIELDL